MNENNIYDYTDVNKFLADRWSSYRRQNSGFSLRAIAKNLGHSSHTILYEILKGKRKVSKNYVQKLARLFKLSTEEVQYFKLLVSYAESRASDDEQSLLDKLKNCALKNQLKVTAVSQSEIQSSPLCFFLLELIQLQETPFNAKQIKERLTLDFSLSDILNAIDILERSGMIKIENNIIKNQVKNLLYTPPDIKYYEASKIYHQKACQLAEKAATNQNANEREFNGICLNIDSKNMNEIKLYLRNFIQDFYIRFNAVGENADTTIQVNLQAFKVT